jgi:deoxyribonuclease V
MAPSPIPRDWLFPPSLDVAAQVQRDLASRVVLEDDLGPVRLLGGADISHNPRDPDALVHAAIVTLDAASLGVTGVGAATLRPSFPYVPGYLGFRECPALVDAWAALEGAKPDLVFVDGQGFSHPRGFGIACQIGVLLGVPTIGVAKSILVGRPAGELGPEAGDRVALEWKGRTVGTVLRTKRRTNPLFISVGHRISLDSAIDWVLRAGRGYRMPEPTRQAHLASNAVRRAAGCSPDPTDA